MNIFVLDWNPSKAARMHNDKHVVKMILEGAQMLSTAHRVLDGVPKLVYFPRRSKVLDAEDNLRFRTVRLKVRELLTLPGDMFRKIHGHTIFHDSTYYLATHRNHPCNVWCRESSGNYEWLWDLTNALCDEYFTRYGMHKTPPAEHKVASSGLISILAEVPKNIKKDTITPFVQAMPDVYKNEDPVMAYRNYYLFDKTNLLQYTHRREPDWVTAKREHDRILLEKYPDLITKFKL